MKVISYKSRDCIEEFVVDIEGYKYYFTEYVDKHGQSTGYELLNEHGREVIDKTVVGVVQDLINRYLADEYN